MALNYYFLRSFYQSLYSASSNSNNSIQKIITNISKHTITRKYIVKNENREWWEWGGCWKEVRGWFVYKSKSCQIQYLLVTNIGQAEITDNFGDKSPNSNSFIAFTSPQFIWALLETISRKYFLCQSHTFLVCAAQCSVLRHNITN